MMIGDTLLMSIRRNEKKMDEVIRRIIKKLLARNYSPKRIFSMFQKSNEFSSESKPSLEEISKIFEEILEISVGLDDETIKKDQGDITKKGNITLEKKDQVKPKLKLISKKVPISSPPLKIQPTHLQCPNCKNIILFRLSKAKRPRKQCPNCKTTREVKYWIEIDQTKNDQPKIASEILSQNDSENDQPKIASETLTQNQEEILNRPEVKTVLEFVAQHLYASNIAKQTGFSKSKITRILQKLQKANIIKQTNKYPKFYDIIFKTKVQAPMWIQKIEDIHRVEFELKIKNPKYPKKDPKSHETYHNLYDNEFPHAKKTKLTGWSRYEINWADFPTHPKGWNIQFNRYCIICNYDLPLTNITDPIQTKKDLEKQLPYNFFKNKGIDIDPSETILIAGGGHARIKTHVPHLDSLGVRQAVSVIDDSTGEELFHADNSERSKSPGIETSIDQASRILAVPQQIEKNQHQVTEQIEKLQQQMTELLTSMQSIKQERSQVQDLINTLQQFTTTLQGQTKAPMEISHPGPNMFT